MPELRPAIHGDHRVRRQHLVDSRITGARSAGRQTRTSLTITAVPILMTLIGCQLGATQFVESRLPFEQQRHEVLGIASLGTPRAEAIEALKDAGIRGSHGGSDSIFYCERWTREEGGTWLMDVALLFDESGKLYDVRNSDAETSFGGPSPPSSVGANRPYNSGTADPSPSSSTVRRTIDSRLPRGGVRRPFADASTP